MLHFLTLEVEFTISVPGFYILSLRGEVLTGNMGIGMAASAVAANSPVFPSGFRPRREGPRLIMIERRVNGECRQRQQLGEFSCWIPTFEAGRSLFYPPPDSASAAPRHINNSCPVDT